MEYPSPHAVKHATYMQSYWWLDGLPQAKNQMELITLLLIWKRYKQLQKENGDGE
jgi:hypothetical protein